MNAPETPAATTVRKPRRGRKIAFMVVGGLLLVLVALVAFAPAIASSIAPGIIESQAAAQLNGTVKVDAVKLSWGGPQRIGPVTVRDAAGKDVATVNADASIGLLALAGGLGDLGTVKLSGKANVVRAADGTTNLEGLMKPGKPAAAPAPGAKPGAPAKLPPNLKLRVIVEKFDVDLADAQLAERTGGQIQTVQLRDLKADTTLVVGGTSDIDMKLTAQTSGTGGPGKGGSLTLKGTIADFSDASGTLTLDKARVDAKVNATELPVAVIDALGGMGGKLAGVVGPTLAAQVDIIGGMAGGDATIKISGEHLKVDGVAKLANNTLTTPTPITIAASGKGLAALEPDLRKMLADQKGVSPLTIGEFPDVVISVSDVNVKLPTGGAKMDLRGSSLAALVKTTRAAGTVVLSDGQAAQAFELRPLELKLAAPDLGGPVRVTGQSSALVGGEPAGAMDIDLTLSGLLDAGGAPVAGLPGGLAGKVALTGLRTVLAQPLAASSGIDLPTDIGPTLDVNLTASTQGTAAAGELPPTNLQFAITSAKLTGNGAVVLSTTGVRALGDGISIRLAGAGALASKFVKPESGIAISSTGSGGDLGVKLTNLSLPLTKDRKPIFDKTEGKLDVTMGGLSVKMTDPTNPGWASAPIDLGSVSLGALLRAGASPHADLNAALSYGGQAFTGVGSFDLVGLFSPDGMSIRADKVRPVGALELKNVPTAIAGVTSKPGAGALDLPGLLRETVGPLLNVQLTTQPSKKLEGGLDMTLTGRGDHLSAELSAALSDTALAIAGAQVESTMAPGTAEYLIKTFAPDMAKSGPAPKLAGPARLVMSVDPLTIPLENMSPKLDKVGEAGVRVSLAGQTIIEGLMLPESKDAAGVVTPARAMGPVGVEDFKLAARAPVGALMGGGSAPVKADLSANLLAGGSRGAEKLATLTGNVDGTIAGGKPGKINAVLKLDSIGVAAMDKFLAPALGQEGMMLGALGADGAVHTTVQMDGSGESMVIAASVLARFKQVAMQNPIQLTVLPDQFALLAPGEFTWYPQPAFLTSLLAKPAAAGAQATAQSAVKAAAGQPAAGQSAPGGQMTVQAIGPINVKLSRLAIAKSVAATGNQASIGPLKPGIFRLGLSASVSGAVVKLEDGKTFKVAGLTTDATDEKDGAINFAVTINGAELIDEKGVAQAPVPTSGIRGNVVGLADAGGNINAAAAVISAVAQVPTFPTALIDALARQDGLLVDALGPTVTLDAKADRVSMDPAKGGGTLSATAKSAFANASLQGKLEKGLFISTAPLSMTLTRIQPSLSQRFVKGLPIVASVEKTEKELPASVVGNGLQVPLDNNLSKLAGNFVLEPGEVRFKTGGGFSKFLGAISQKQEGTIGKKLKPLTVNIVSGVAKYQRWELPVGEFSVQTEGTIDLVQRRLEVYTYVPFAALSDEAAGAFKASLGNVPVLSDVLKAATLMPFKTSGSFDNPKTEPDLEQFVKEFGKSIRPDELLKKGLEEGLGDLFKKKGK